MMIWDASHGLLFDSYAVGLLCSAFLSAWLLMSKVLPLVGEEAKPSVGAFVRVVFYNHPSKYSGSVGICERWNDKMERWEVRLQSANGDHKSSGDLKVFKPKNLVVIDPPLHSRSLLRRIPSLRSNNSQRSNSSRDSTNSEVSTFSRQHTSTVNSAPVWEPVSSKSRIGTLWTASVSPSENSGRRSTRQEKSSKMVIPGMEPGMMRPSSCCQAGHSAFGEMADLKRILWRQLIFAVCATAAAIWMLGRTVSAPDREVLDGFSWSHQFIFAWAFAHCVNMIWEDISTSNFITYNSHGVALASFGLSRCCGAKGGVLMVQIVVHIAMAAFYCVALFQWSLGGVGLQALLLEAPRVLTISRHLAFTAQSPPHWMRRRRLVNLYWRLVMALMVLTYGSVLTLWAWTTVDFFRGRCGLSCGLDSTSRLSYSLLGALLTVYCLRFVAMVRGWHSIDLIWAGNFSRSTGLSGSGCCSCILMWQTLRRGLRPGRMEQWPSQESQPQQHRDPRVSCDCSIRGSEMSNAEIDDELEPGQSPAESPAESAVEAADNSANNSESRGTEADPSAVHLREGSVAKAPLDDFACWELDPAGEERTIAGMRHLRVWE